MTLQEYFKDYKQNRFAIKLGMDKCTLSKKLTGMQKFTPEDAVRIERLTEKKVTREEVLPNFDWTLFHK